MWCFTRTHHHVSASSYSVDQRIRPSRSKSSQPRRLDAALALFSAFAFASSTRHHRRHHGQDDPQPPSDQRLWRARPASLTVLVPALGSRPSASQRCRSLVFMPRISWISRGMTGRDGASSNALETTEATALKAALASAGIAKIRSTPSREIAFLEHRWESRLDLLEKPLCPH